MRAILDVTLDARLPLATAAIAGTATNPGTLAGVLPKLLAQISDQTVNTGVLNGASFDNGRDQFGTASDGPG